eukprot:GHVL01017970.1.p1 GENE.GHVL01017970.1~~GHVL01017970.1.p1  ORF type:complete len:355 (-),score=72.41 GHVL01017970.1:476-1540(-)
MNPLMQKEDISINGQKANQLWKFLDNMAETDMDGYQKFIKRQQEEYQNMKNSEKDIFIPETGFVIKSNLQIEECATKIFYVNVCHSEKCLAPLRKDHQPCTSMEELTDASVRVSIGNRREIKDSVVIDIVVNTMVVNRAKSEYMFKKWLSQLILNEILVNEQKLVTNKKCKFGSIEFLNESYKFGETPQKHELPPFLNKEIWQQMTSSDTNEILPKTHEKDAIQTLLTSFNSPPVKQGLIQELSCSVSSDSKNGKFQKKNILQSTAFKGHINVNNGQNKHILLEVFRVIDNTDSSILTILVGEPYEVPKTYKIGEPYETYKKLLQRLIVQKNNSNVRFFDPLNEYKGYQQIILN